MRAFGRNFTRQFVVMSDVVSISGDTGHSEPVRVLPDKTVCRVQPIGTVSDFANCLVEQPKECPYVLYFGEGNVCRFPRWREFVIPAKKTAEDGPGVA